MSRPSRNTGNAGGRRGEGRPIRPPFLEVNSLKLEFDVSPPWVQRVVSKRPRQWLKAVDGVDFYIRRGSTFGLVGESGCGKSTLARLVVGLYDPTEGAVSLGGVNLTGLRAQGRLGEANSKVQMIFQDPYSSLNPRWKVGEIIAEPIRMHGLAEDESAIRRSVVALLEQVGLSGADARKYPHEFSGGQRQRISIARALAGEPELLICDEPTSALDVSVQSQILNLMCDLRDEHGLTMLFISHDLPVIDFIADEVGVMYLGRLCEVGTPEVVFSRPQHPYTRMLLDSVPTFQRRGHAGHAMIGEVPSPINPPSGCTFHPRCPFANERCRAEVPALIRSGESWVACHGVAEGRIPPTGPDQSGGG
ncbi:MAG: ABC transporter ATP-binding protein [Alphaproteobacteria bacterium]|nr:MAG: ABC transporter ATP-binding protein [Alphaproteobacteria bacterium]